MRYLFLVQARLGSTRLRNKVLMSLGEGERSIIQLVYERTIQAKEANKNNVVVLTTTLSEDDQLVQYLLEHKINYWRGESKNVFQRFYQFLQQTKDKPDYVVRVCADNPFVDPSFIDRLTDHVNMYGGDADYFSFKDYRGTPAILTHYGFFCELVRYDAFVEANTCIMNDLEREHVTPIFYRNSRFKTEYLDMPSELAADNLRFTVDTLEDFVRIKRIFNLLRNKSHFSYKDTLGIVCDNPELVSSMEQSINTNKKSYV